jgi:hypothetical protein
MSDIKGKAEEAVGCLILLGVVAFLLWIGWGWVPDKCKYSMVYSVDSDHVYVEDEPKDCDFIHAPIGDKGCRYHKQVTPLRDDKGKITSVSVTWEKANN